MIKLIVFDMDGTLVDSDALIKKVYQTLTDQFPPKIPLDLLHEEDLYSCSYYEMLNKLYGFIDPIHLQTIKETVFLNRSSLHLFNHALKTLVDLKAQGYLMALLTSELKDIAYDVLHTLKLVSFFDAIITYDDVLKPKPDPEGLTKLMTRFQLKPYEVIIVGDRLTDGLAGQALHIETLFINHQKRPMPTSFQGEISRLSDLIGWLNQRNRLKLSLTKDSINILQLTDLHLMNHPNDSKTYALMRQLIDQTKPDLICLTGDQTMSNQSDQLYQALIHFFESINIPYAWVFGNHDTDYQDHQQLIAAIYRKANPLLFSPGPPHLGFSNYVIEIENSDNDVVGLLIFLDSHRDDVYCMNEQKVWGYGTIHEAQINWLESISNRYHGLYHLVFLHIPPYEVSLITPENRTAYQGDYHEKPSTPPINTGWVDRLNQHHQTAGIFFGHDHYNTFSFQKDGIFFAYGLTTGHYEYQGPHPKGGRLITWSFGPTLTSVLIKDPSF